MKNQNKKKNKGFTLIEMLVSMTLFSFVITMALGALFMILKANERAKIVRVVVNNLNVALEGMSRELRMGSEYHTENGSTKITFKTKEGCDGGYWWTNGILKRAISRRLIPTDPTTCDPDPLSNDDYIPLTGEDIDIDKMGFVLDAGGGGAQPKVFIYLKGEIANSALGVNEPLYIQTLISQRKLQP